MPKNITRQSDHPGVTERASALQAQTQVQYWIVLSYQDGLDLLAGTVPCAVLPQIRTLVKRDRLESADAYTARLREARL